ncbi:hypothetical protein MKX03_035183 [Papaver bracteatum]|nr:hypothetical protein MKX03_035183 [Papaver bracteatum]
MRFRLKHNLKAFKNKFTKLKERYRDHKKLMEDNIGVGWDPILCTVDASNEWWDDHVKVFCVSGCPEYSKLAMIYGDTVAMVNLIQTQDGGIDSSDDEDEINVFEEEVPQPSLIPPFHGSDVNDGNIDNQTRGCSCNPSGTNRSTPVFGNNGGIINMMEDNVDDHFRH